MGRKWNRRRRQFIARSREGEALWWRRDYFRPLEDPTPWHLYHRRKKGTQPFTNTWIAECGATYDFDEVNLEIIPLLRKSEPPVKYMCDQCKDIYQKEWIEE